MENKKIKNIISIDVEQWFHRPILNKYLGHVNQASEHILESVRVILHILKKHEKRTTFFVLGKVAENVPEVIEEILNGDHEIAFHGYSHLPLSEIGCKEFEKEVKKGIGLLSHITREKVKGFRSPMFSLTKETVWALKTIDKFGFKYDSSIFPTITPLYGSKNAPIYPYNPSFEDPSKEDITQNKIFELPILTRKYSFLRLPAGGGFYMRLFGVQFIRESIKRINKEGYPAMCYFHPWELSDFPKINMPFYKKVYAYYGIPCLDKFEQLIKSVEMVPAIETLENMGWVK